MPWNRFTNQEGLAYIASATPSGVSSVSFNNVFTSNYTNYRITYSLTLSSGTQGVWIRLRAGGADNTTGSNTWNFAAGYLNVITGGQTSNASGASGNTRGQLARINTNGGAGAIDIFEPQKLSHTIYSGVTMSPHLVSVVDGTVYYVGGQQTQTLQWDGLTVLSEGLAFSGYIGVYGYIE